MFFILLAFILDEFVKRFNQNTIQYNLTNIIGSGLLAYYAYTSKVWPFLILNSVWFIVAAYKIILIKTAPHKVKKKHK
ncbi:hypothetical protein COY27_05750 [Candidatus Woesearchaeota archaeon CG_4_10_14_0_2_um_filter_33_13]|nr:MAG: hypothetical protein COY27_05750 [Candidatus Woesearchaeota archaeon CG_4_10_14_0_2_um_filter_33_13]